MNTTMKLTSRMIALLVPLILLVPHTLAETGPLIDPHLSTFQGFMRVSGPETP